jgi:hypothetical protein
MYCSVACCRKHKEICTGVLAPAPPRRITEESSITAAAGAEIPNSNDSSLPAMISPPDYADYGPDWVLPLSSTRDRLRASAGWLHQRLARDPSLRQQIATLLATPDTPVRGSKNNARGNGAVSWTEREVLLEQLRRQGGGEVGAFLEELEVIGGVLERQGASSSVPLDEWLKGSQEERTRAGLCLAAASVGSTGTRKQTRHAIISSAAALVLPPVDCRDAMESCASDDDDDDDDTSSSDTSSAGSSDSSAS